MRRSRGMRGSRMIPGSHMREPVQIAHMREDRREQDRRDFKEDRRDPMMRRDSRAPPLMTEEERRGPMRQNRRVKFR